MGSELGGERGVFGWCSKPLVENFPTLLSSVLCPRRQHGGLSDPFLDEGKAQRRLDDEEAPTGPVEKVQHLSLKALDGERIRVRDNVFSRDFLDGLLANVKASTYFGENNGENGFYKGTWGFHVKFRDTHRREVEAHLPFLKPVLDETLHQECNCFFLNVFYARPDGQGYHTDNYFTDYCGAYRPTDIVTVAYIAVAEDMAGGELVVLDKAQEELGQAPERGSEEGSVHVLERVTPTPGRVVDFDGRLLHAVHAFQSESQGPRVSLVIEQCKLTRRHFLKTPKFNIYCQRTNRDLVIA